VSDEQITPLRPQVYLDERPAEYFTRFHARARRRGPDYIYDLARLLVMPYCIIAFRARCQELERVPEHGPAILAPNHFSAMDHWFCGIYLRRRIRFMAKSQLFKGPLTYILSHGGAFPVRRGHHDDESMATALQILANGGILVIYPEGGRSRSAHIGERARPGVGRLALESGAPVIPVAIHGSLHARRWRQLRFPRVTVRYGAPLRFPALVDPPRERQQAVADEILAAARKLYGELDAERDGARAASSLAG
jgi:1-acyl-sn-glycerol-3-phosphate acyltransferase